MGLMTDRRYGKRIRTLRQREGLTQGVLATRLDISPSYLNLIENDRRPLTTDLLLKLAQVFNLDLRYFSGEDDAHLTADMAELFGDAIFEDHPLTGRDIADFVAHSPDVARAVVRLHQAYTHARTSAEALAQRVLDDQDAMDTVERSRLSSEQLSDLLHRHGNYFPQLEAAAESLWREASLHEDDLYTGLVQFIERAYRVLVKVVPLTQLGGAVRRYDPARRELLLSEALQSSSRTFQLATQIGILHCAGAIARIADDPQLTSDDARALARVVLAGYFAGAVLMPYTTFLNAAQETRYDIELLSQRFRTGFEQTCHRLTTLRRPGMEGVNFYFVRVDMAGNISKKFSSAGIRFPRFSGLCPLWNVHAAFLQPGVVRVQISRQLDGTTVLAIARTVRRHVGTYHAPMVLYSVGIGCDLSEAHKLVYADGIDISNPALAVPIGITCRLCERVSCQARAFPSVHRPLRVDENVRGASFYAPPEG
jgi:predicted transcriptional regulator/transcriptional regulator with XRE-family HTH domain